MTVQTSQVIWFSVLVLLIASIQHGLGVVVMEGVVAVVVSWPRTKDTATKKKDKTVMDSMLDVTVVSKTR